MGFSKGRFARVWRVDDKGNYAVCQLSTSKKNKDTEQYEVDFQDGFVKFVADAHKKITSVDISDKGIPIKISSCDVTNKFDKEKNKIYVNYTVFGIELSDEFNNGEKAGSATKPKAATKAKLKTEELEEFVEVTEDELPF